MTNRVRVQFAGGGFDGMELIYSRDDFRNWDGFRPSGWFGSDRTRFFYQGDDVYSDGDATVTMSLVATATHVSSPDDDSDRESGYDGYLPVEDRYHDSEGGG